MSETQKPTARTKEETIRLNRWGRDWLTAFAAILRTSQFHDPQNQIFDEPIVSLLSNTGEILDVDGRAEFRILEDQFFLNGLWIKPALSEKDNLFSLAESFRRMGLGGITLQGGTTDEHWRTLIGILHSVRGPTVNRSEQINTQLAQNGIEEVEVHQVLTIQDTIEHDKPLPPAAYQAVSTYAKALAALRDFSRSAPGEEQIIVLRKAQRIVCDMIDIYDKSPVLFHTLCLFKNFESYFFHHGVNVLILSILIGREIGLNRKEAADLGMSALLHDIGKLAIPETILSKESHLTKEEWEQIREHPIESTKTFLSLGYMNESVAERALVAYQHHWASRRPHTYPKPRRSMTPSLMSEIVAVAVTYDALTTDKTYRASFTPWEANRILARQSDEGFYRKEIVDALLRVLGPIPVGSWVAVDGATEGLVAASGIFAPTKHFPLVLSIDAEGRPHWIDTGQIDTRTGKVPKIVAKRTTSQKYREVMRTLFQNVTSEGTFATEVITASDGIESPVGEIGNES